MQQRPTSVLAFFGSTSGAPCQVVNLTTMGKAAASAEHTQFLVLWINRAMEALWLLAVVLVPLAFLGRLLRVFRIG